MFINSYNNIPSDSSPNVLHSYVNSFLFIYFWLTHCIKLVPKSTIYIIFIFQMEKIKENSAKLKTEILGKLESEIKGFINKANQYKLKRQKEFSNEIESLNEEIEKINEIIERDEAVVSFIKSQLCNNGKDKENSVNIQKNVYSEVISTREYAAKVNGRLRLYEKRLGLSLKKLESNTL